MKRFVIPILVVCAFCAPAASQNNSTKPARQRTPRTITYKKPTAAQIDAARKKAAEFAKAARELLKVEFQVIETDHFVIFSTWPEEKNRPLKRVAEDVYKALCKQFAVPEDTNIWVGKCPVYIFAGKEDYIGFTTQVDKLNNLAAAGYCFYDFSGFCYIVMGPCSSDEQFHEIFTHETTHGFVNRYLSPRPIPGWVSEGVADFMASTLAPNSMAAIKCEKAEKEVVDNGADGSKVFKGVELNSFDYGVSQSIVRFMVAKSSKKFTRFITLMKKGKTEDEALKEAYGCTHEELYEAWLKATKEKLSKSIAATAPDENAPAESTTGPGK